MDSGLNGAIVDALPGLVWTAREDGCIDSVNQRWLDYTGVSEDDIIGLGWRRAVHPEDLPQLLEYWRARLRMLSALSRGSYKPPQRHAATLTRRPTRHRGARR